jgi:hypothetical protein
MSKLVQAFQDVLEAQVAAFLSELDARFSDPLAPPADKCKGEMTNKHTERTSDCSAGTRSR